MLEERFSSNQATADAVATAVQYQYVWDQRYIDTPICRFTFNTSGAVTQTLYYLTDANNNVTALFDGANTTGQVAARYVYDAYGNFKVYNNGWNLVTDTAGHNASLLGNEILYCGYRFDPETAVYDGTSALMTSGNFQDRNREDNTVYQWLQRDPAGYPDGTNAYGYAASDPIRYADPTGETIYVCPEGPGPRVTNKDVDDYLSRNGVSGYLTSTVGTGASAVFQIGNSLLRGRVVYSGSRNKVSHKHGNVTSEILYGMIVSKRDFVIKGGYLPELQRHVKVREEVAALGAKQALGWHFHGGQPDKYGTITWGSQWEKSNVGIPLNDYAAAVQEAIDSPDSFAFDCNTAQHLLLLAAEEQVLGASDFKNAVGTGAGGNQLSVAGAWGRLNVPEATSNTEHGVISPTNPLYVGDDKDWIPGDGGRVNNPGANEGSAWGGEYVTCIGDDLYYANGLGDLRMTRKRFGKFGNLVPINPLGAHVPVSIETVEYELHHYSRIVYPYLLQWWEKTHFGPKPQPPQEPFVEKWRTYTKVGLEGGPD